MEIKDLEKTLEASCAPGRGPCTVRTNADRAARAEEVLRIYAGYDQLFEEDVIDLVSDLLHWVGQNLGHCTHAEILRIAEGHYEEEAREEEAQS